MKLYQTTYEDIEAVCDALMPMPKADTKGVRVPGTGNIEQLRMVSNALFQV